MKKLNFKKLRQEIDAVSNELRFIRNNGFCPAERRMQELRKLSLKQCTPEWDARNKEYAELRKHTRAYLRDTMTILCSIRAQHHGRLHRRRVSNPYANVEGQPKYKEITVEDQVKLIQQFVGDYEQEVEPTTKN